MNERIYPRSPRERMDGWMHLPRYIDKIRLHLAGKLHPDYQANLGKGFDGLWAKTAGVTHEQMIAVVRASVTDGEVCDWVRQNVKKSAAEKKAHGDEVLTYPKAGDAAAQQRFQQRKKEYGFENREDIRCFVELIDADEKRI